MLYRFLEDLNSVGELGALIRDEIKKLDGATAETKEKVRASLDNLSDAAHTHIDALDKAHASSIDFLKLINASKEYLDTVFNSHASNLQQIAGDKDEELNPKVAAAIEKIKGTSGEEFNAPKTFEALKTMEEAKPGEVKPGEVEAPNTH